MLLRTGKAEGIVSGKAEGQSMSVLDGAPELAGKSSVLFLGPK